MKRALLGSAAAIGAIRLAGMGLGLLVTILIGRTLGPKGLGAYGYTVILLSLLAVPVSNGWSTLLLRRVAAGTHDGQWSEAKGMMTRGTQAAVVVALLVLLVTGGLGLMVPSSPVASYGWGVAAVLGCVLFFDQLSALRLAMLRGLNHPVWGQMPEMLVRPALIVLTFGVLLAASGKRPTIDHAFWAMGIASCASAAIGALVLWRKRPAALARALPSYRTHVWMTSAGILAANAGLIVLNSYVDILMLGVLGTIEQVGVYRIATQLALLSGFAYTALNMLAAPRFAALRAAQNHAALQSNAVFMARLALLGALPLPILFMLQGSPIIQAVFGREFTAALHPMFLLFAGQAVNAAAGMASSLLMMSGHESKVMRATLLAVVVNACVSAVCIPQWGVVGAALGNLAAMIAWNMALWATALKLTAIDTSVFGKALSRETRVGKIGSST
jgi:O-antigen/teichoic acid export membrane protein